MDTSKMRTVLGVVLVGAALATGCKPAGVATKPPAVTQPARVPGQWQTSVVQYQFFEKLLFRDKKTGKLLEPDTVSSRTPEDVALEPADYTELTYQKGRMRYVRYIHDDDAQPYVVERPVAEADFEALDVALFDDKFFTYEERNWDPKARLPMFVVTYERGAVAQRASFTPSMAKLPRTAKVLAPYIAQLGGEEKPPPGVTHTTYSMQADKEGLHVAVTTLADGADLTETPLNLKRADVNIGGGFKEALLGPTPNTLTFDQPVSKEPYVIIELKLTPAAVGAATTQTLIPVRARQP